MKKFKDVVASLKREGARECKSHIKSVSFTDKDDYTQVNLSLVEEVEGYVLQEDGSYAKGNTNIVSMPVGVLRRTLRENEDFFGLDREVLCDASIAKMILAGAEVTILCEDVAEAETHSDPFAENGEEKVVEHTTIYHYVVDLKVSSLGAKRLLKLEDKIFEKGLASLA